MWKLKEILKGNLRYGSTVSCGCYGLAKRKAKATKHGMFGTSVYAIWGGMIGRATNPKDKYYPRYGANGISVSDSWRKFENFYADMGDRPEGTSLDRIDNTKGYSKENCRWATRVEQQNNLKSSVRAEYRGAQITVADMVKLSGLNKSTIDARLRRLWAVEDVINTPLGGKPSQPPTQIKALSKLYPAT